MAQVIYTIDEYVVKERKRDTYWLVFNTVYNDIHAFKKELERNEDDTSRYLREEFTDNEAREEFLEYMKSNFPQTKIIKVFDLVNAGYLIYPYLGSMAIDCEKDDEVFTALSQKYGNPYDDAIVNNAIFWVLDYENAKQFYDERNEALEAEFSE
jgi:hypothetical protein